MCYKYFISIHFSLKYTVYTLWVFTSGLVRLDAYAIAWEECKSTFGMYVKERKQSFLLFGWIKLAPKE